MAIGTALPVRLAGILINRLSPARRRRLRRLARPAWLGTLRRTTPLGELWGRDRGAPVDRYYIEQFLQAHRSDIHGRVLEVKNSKYTAQFGVGVTRREAIDINRSNKQATIITDLTKAEAIRSDSFDCIILTQTLQQIYDMCAVIEQAHRLLRSGGVLLATVPMVSQVDREAEHDYWRFTTMSCSRLFGEAFGAHQIQVWSYGNVLTAIAFLSGMAREELSQNELDANDPSIPLIIAVRAVKGNTTNGA